MTGTDLRLSQQKPLWGLYWLQQLQQRLFNSVTKPFSRKQIWNIFLFYIACISLLLCSCEYLKPSNSPWLLGARNPSCKWKIWSEKRPWLASLEADDLHYYVCKWQSIGRNSVSLLLQSRQYSPEEPMWSCQLCSFLVPSQCVRLLVCASPVWGF